MLRAVSVTIVMLAAGACSGDELPDELPPAQVRDGLGALFAGDHPSDRQTEAGRCFADELTERVSLEQLRDAGVLDDRNRVAADVPPLPPDLAEAWADAQFQCTDFVAESTRAQEALTRGAIDADAYARCLREALSEEQMRAAVVATLTGDFEAEPVTVLAKTQSSCAKRTTPQP